MKSSSLIYVTDPLCLWCYGIASTIEKFMDTIPNTVAFETINGGLFPGKQAKLCDYSFVNYLKEAAVHVTQLSGKEFSPMFWKLISKGDFRYDTEPAAKASVIVKKLAGEKAMIKYIHALQNAFFIEGKNITLSSTLALLAKPLGIEPYDFLYSYLSDEYTDLTKQQYSEAKQLGISGFPALLFIKGNQAYKLAAGYTTLETLNNNFNLALEKSGYTTTHSSNSCSETGCKI